MTRLHWVVLRPKTALSFPWSDTGKAAALRVAGNGGRVVVGVKFETITQTQHITHTLYFDAQTGREIDPCN